jgi:hypothetical protein
MQCLRQHENCSGTKFSAERSATLLRFGAATAYGPITSICEH